MIKSILILAGALVGIFFINGLMQMSAGKPFFFITFEIALFRFGFAILLTLIVTRKK